MIGICRYTGVLTIPDNDRSARMRVKFPLSKQFPISESLFSHNSYLINDEKEGKTLIVIGA